MTDGNELVEMIELYRTGDYQSLYELALECSHGCKQTVSYILHEYVGVDPHTVLSKVQHTFYSPYIPIQIVTEDSFNK